MLAARLGFFPKGRLQVVHLAPEAQAQAEMQSAHKGGLAGLIPEAGAGQQEAQGLGVELPVHEQQLAELGVLGLVAVFAGPGVVPTRGFTALHLAALATELEALHLEGFAGDRMGGSHHRLLAEVDLAEGGAGQVFGAEGKLLIGDRQRNFAATVVREDQQLAVEEERVALLGVIAEPAAGVFRGGLHLAQAGHLLDLAVVCVAAVAAAGAFPAAEVVVGFAAGVGAGGAEAPALGFVEVGVDLINPHAAALGIELAIGHQLADGHVGGAFVAQGRQILTAAAITTSPISRTARQLAPEHGFERHTRFREGVIGEEPFVGEHCQ